MKPADKPVLCVVSSHPIKGASGVPTGFFLAELTHPLKVLEDAGLKTMIASIRGGQPPVDGFDLSDPVNAWYWNETDFQQRLATTPALSELNGSDYSAVFFAGGHGTMWDFRDSQMPSVLSAKCMKVMGLSQPSATDLRHWLTQSSAAANTW
jgi:putative intracellular protease/amidase